MDDQVVGKLTIVAARLSEAMSAVLPVQKKSKRQKPVPFDLWVPADGLLRISESRYELVGYDIPAVVNFWPDCVQLDGQSFQRIITSYSAAELLELQVTADKLTIRSGMSCFSVSRLDAPGRVATKRAPLPKLRRVQVQVDDRPHRGRVELDATWGFSARMPVEQHKHPSCQIPEARGKPKG